MRKIKLEVKTFATYGWILLYSGDDSSPLLREAVKNMVDNYSGHATRVTYGPEETE